MAADRPGEAGPAHRPSALRVLGWAAFLGSSWTWCIGMFLPVLLVRDLGVWGWVVFAVPNVVGAAAMGWVLRTAEASRQLATRHRAACLAFSLVTIAFHLFFLGWFVGGRLLPAYWVGIALAAAVTMWLVLRWRNRSDLILAVSVLGVSLLAFAAVGAGVGFRSGQPGVGSDSIRPIDALWLAPVCIFGFLFCPYLDLTFHRARQDLTPAGARGAFTLGFGAFFFLMILFSLAYAPALSGLASGVSPAGPLPALLVGAIGVHMVVQSAFTLAVHLRELDGPERTRVGWGVATAALMGSLALGALCAVPRTILGLDGGELVYRLFMSFYGLVFPAYVWLVMIPGRRDALPMARRRLIVLGACTLLAAPLFWMGFVRGDMLWLMPGLIVVLAGRALL